MNKSFFIKLIAFTVFSFVSLVKGEKCESPQFSVTSYLTTDGRLAAEAAIQLEITVRCKSGKHTGTLFADLYGQIIPCAQSTVAPGKYFVSVAATTHKQLTKGSIKVKLHDDDSYTAIRKARTEEAIQSVKPYGEVEVYNPGASYGPWLPSEFIALIVFGLIWWIAYRERSKILI